MKIEKPAKLVIDIFNCLRKIRNQKLYLLPERSAIKSYIYYPERSTIKSYIYYQKDRQSKVIFITRNMDVKCLVNIELKKLTA